MFADAVQQISTADADLQANMPYIDRLLVYLSEEAAETAGRKRGEVVEADNRRQERLTENVVKMWEPASNVICLEKVDFCYPDIEKAVFCNLNLTIFKGERVAIIGKRGCGKTTLLKLITGMLVPAAGQIYFSGVNLAEIDLEAMYNRIGYVMQENVLFHTTIRENILLGNEKAAESDIWTACRKACIYDFIKSLPEGLDTVIGERGIKLSGGQRQRIVLARTFLRDVDIYIFDEATSALDEYSESIVQEAIENIGDDKTIIVVSHRESSLKLCDRVINLEHLVGIECC